MQSGYYIFEVKALGVHRINNMKNSALKLGMAVLGQVLMLGGVSACAKSQKPDVTYKSHEIADPIEPINRFVFGFNDILDKILIEPVAKGYNAVLPGFVRDSVQSFMRNLNSPLIVANNLLQGKVGDAGIAAARFALNTTVGVAGLADVAQAQGLSYKEADFGQTLAVWGVGDGFYLVLPVLGPSSLRDAVGLAVDSYADPVRIVADNTNNDWIYYTLGAIEGIDTRSRLIKVVDDLRRNSLDYYAAVRSAHSQKRDKLIHPGKAGDAPKGSDYDSP